MLNLVSLSPRYAHLVRTDCHRATVAHPAALQFVSPEASTC